MALNEAGTDLPLARPEVIERHGFLPAVGESKHNPDGLPVGFVKEGRADWIGFSCAGCHTSQVNYNGVGYRIDGAGMMGTYKGLLLELMAALDEAVQDPHFDGFAHRVLGKKHNAKRAAALRVELLESQRRVQAYINVTKTEVSGDYGRVDALGGLFNHAFAIQMGMPENFRPLRSPVSYPSLWDANRSDRTQWNGFSQNDGFGRIARDISQALGVWGQVDVQGGPNKVAYASSIKVESMIESEERLRSLRSPPWPDAFPPIDSALATRGKALYEAQCLSCHELVDPVDPKRALQTVMVPLDEIGTDRNLAEEFEGAVFKTGPLEGRTKLASDERFGPEARGHEILLNLLRGVILGQLPDASAEILLAARQKRSGPLTDPGTNDGEELLAYRARALNGVWATAPLLHNGSVPTLYELMKPAAERSATFWTGSKEFDPVEVGIVKKPMPGGFLLDTSLDGNSNAGHEYGTGLSDEDRWAIVEFVKTL